MDQPARSMSSRQFNQSAAAAKRAARAGPVLITDRGRPSHVLLSYEHYRELRGATASLGDLLSRTPGVADVEFEIPDRSGAARPVNLE